MNCKIVSINKQVLPLSRTKHVSMPKLKSSSKMTFAVFKSRCTSKTLGKYREKQCIHVKTGNSDGTNHGKFTAMILNLIALRHSVTLCKITSCCPKPFGAPHFGREEMRGLPQSVWPSLTFDQTSVSVSPRFSGQLRDFFQPMQVLKVKGLSMVIPWPNT